MTEHAALRTKSADDTRDLGAALARHLAPGDVVVLSGDLGAGKTTMTQGLARALGVDEPVQSPTFTLMRQYECLPRLLHLDIYRLDRVNEVLDLGLHELLDEGAVAVVEWGDAVAPTLASSYLEVRFELGAGDDERAIDVQPVGASWVPRFPGVALDLERWRR
jgi:tRNA threonylcarbamoyladenosine biosynthesis protein TsaE